MFLVDDNTVVSVRRAYVVGGTTAAAQTLKKRYLALTDATAEQCVASILSWKPPTTIPSPTGSAKNRKR